MAKDERSDGALIWMSAGNSYFKEETIEKLLMRYSKKFSRILVLSPDKPAIHNFLSLGYDEKEASRKARLNANLLKHRAERVIAKLKKKGTKANLFTIADWDKEISNNKTYLENLDQITQLYDNNPEFRKDARKATQKFCLTKEKHGWTTKKTIDEGVKYLLEELAFVFASPKIYGLSSVAYLYHKEWLIYKNLIRGQYDNRLRTEFSFVLVR
jgi:tRNA-dependent cyclodipeptide synthase